MASILQIFGNNIRKMRLKRNISQQELANICDLHRTYIGIVERAEKNITLLNAAKIAEGLDVELTFLLTETDDK